MIVYSTRQRKIVIENDKGTFKISPNFIKPECLLNILFNTITHEDKKDIAFGYQREKDLENKFNNLLDITI